MGQISIDQPRQPTRRNKIIIAIVLGIAIAGGLLLAGSSIEPMRATIWRMVGHSCGTITYASANKTVLANLDTIPGGEDCFVRAYQHCQAATLTYISPLMNGATTHTFIVEPPVGPVVRCALADAWDTSIMSYLGKGSIGSGTPHCAGMRREQDVLHMLSCGDKGDVLVPGT